MENSAWRTIAQGVSPLIAALGLLWGAAQFYAQGQDHERRLVELETHDKAAAMMDRANAERLARIEEKLAYLVEARGERK